MCGWVDVAIAGGRAYGPINPLYCRVDIRHFHSGQVVGRMEIGAVGVLFVDREGSWEGGRREGEGREVKQSEQTTGARQRCNVA